MASKTFFVLSLLPLAFANPLSAIAKRTQAASVCSAYPYSSATSCMSSSARTAPTSSAFVAAVCGRYGLTSTIEETVTTVPTITSTTTIFPQTVYDPTATTVVTANITLNSTSCITTTQTVTNFNQTSTSVVTNTDTTITSTSTEYTCPIYTTTTSASPPILAAYKRQATTTTSPLPSVTLQGCLSAFSSDFGFQGMVTACDCLLSGSALATATRTEYADSDSTTITEVVTETAITTIAGVATSSYTTLVTAIVTSVETLTATVPIVSTSTYIPTTTITITEPSATNFDEARLAIRDPSTTDDSSNTYCGWLDFGNGRALACPGNSTTGDRVRINSDSELVDLDLTGSRFILAAPNPNSPPLAYWQQDESSVEDEVLYVDVCNGTLRVLGSVTYLCTEEGDDGVLVAGLFAAAEDGRLDRTDCVEQNIYLDFD